MHTREINDIAIKLNSIINTVDMEKLHEFVNEMERTILNNDMLDPADKQNLKESYNNGNKHYQINLTDKEIIKNAKSVINLLRSLESTIPSVLKPTLDKLVNTMQTGSHLNAAGNVASLGATVMANTLWSKVQSLWSSSAPETPISQVMQLKDDLKAFYLYTTQLGSFVPNMNDATTKSTRALASIQGVLEHRNIIESAEYLATTRHVFGGANEVRANTPGTSVSDNKEDKGISVTLHTMKNNIFGNISDVDKDKFYNKSTDRFDIPENSTGNKPENINMMIAYNVSDRARKSLNSINHFMETWDRTKSIPVSQIPALIELLNKVGKVVGELNSLDKNQLSDILRDDLHNGIKELVETVGPILPQLASIAQETELRSGLKDGSILSHLKSVCEQYDSIAQKYNAVVPVKYPFPAQKNAIISRLSAECDSRIEKLHQTKENIAGMLPALDELRNANANIPDSTMVTIPDKLPSIELLKNLQQAASTINTQAGSDLGSMTNKIITAVTGRYYLDVDIAKAERKVAELHEEREQYMKQESIPADLSNALDNLKNLYAMRDNLLSGNKEQHYVTSSSGVGQLKAGLKIPGKINNLFFSESMESISNELKKAAASAYADIDVLTQVEENKKKNMQSHAVKDGNAAKLTTIGGASKESVIENQKIADRNKRSANRAKLGALGRMNAADIAEAAQNERQNNKSTSKQTIQDPKEAFLQSIVEKNNGPVISACTKAKSFLIKSCSDYLTTEQRSLLAVKQQKNGLFIKSENDGIIVENIKDMHNALTRVTELMKKINLIQYHVSQSDYLKILPMMPEIMKDFEAVANEFARTNQSLNNLRNYMSDAGSDNVSAISQIYGNITQYLPSQLLDIQDKVGIVLMTTKDRSISDNAKDMMSQCSNLISNIDGFARNIKPDPVRAATTARSVSATASINMGSDAAPMTDHNKKVLYDALQSITGNLEEKIPANMHQFKKNDGSYNLNKLANGSREHKIASAINLAIVTRKGLESTEKIARKDSFVKSGLSIMAQISPLLQALEGLGNTDLYNKEIKPFLEMLEPTIMRAYAFTAVSERALGTSNLLTSQIDAHINNYIILAKQCNAELKGKMPYLDLQGEIAAAHIQHLEDQHKQRAVSLTSADNQLGSLKSEFERLITENKVKVSVSAFGGAERETPTPTFPSIETLMKLQQAASNIPTIAGRNLSTMANTMIHALTGLDILENDLVKAKSTVAALKEEMQLLASGVGLSSRSKERFEKEIATAEAKVEKLEDIHHKLSTSGQNQHYISANNGSGSIHDGLRVPPELQKLHMGEDMESILKNMQSTLKNASTDIQSLRKEDADNLNHMRNIFQVPQQSGLTTTSTRRM